ncbi:SDR family oxidoreductase [Sphingobacterium sp. HJSM2_6]|uniref:SDR family oxidoreductase n=1 Tax=Sphingobacterium sp. HJSM2_6 TaxID=3366264 RepID=UPI003BDC8CB8
MKNNKVLITGGTAGIGRAISILLAKHGYQIFLIGRSRKKMNDLLQDLEELNLADQFVFSLTDVTDLTIFEKQIMDWENQYGTFDVLINNAGIGYDTVLGKSIKDIQYLVNTNLLSYMWLAGHIGEQMIINGIEGYIIQIGSMSATTKDAESSGYVATKSGIQGFSEALRKELNPKNIRVALIEPGLCGSDMQSTSPKEEIVLQEKLEMLKAEDIADLVLTILRLDPRIDVCELKVKPLKQII